jgi:hypothetical protein
MKVHHGLTSIILVLTVFGMCLAVLAVKSLALTIIYFLFLTAGLLVIIYSYCAKCSVKDNCSHIIVGKFTRFVPSRKVEPYTRTDFISIGLSFILLYAVSFFVLWNYKTLTFTAVLLLFLTAAEIKVKVCPVCKNTYCPINKI